MGSWEGLGLWGVLRRFYSEGTMLIMVCGVIIFDSEDKLIAANIAAVVGIERLEHVL
eukprot:SAG31_NODE_36018_length_317_cov_0.935780_1_plen_57_part_00